MLKVLLVDDEPAICALLLRLIDWEGLNLVCVGTAGDGLEAQNMIRQHQPDIVITDIQLPGMTGLELIESVVGQGGAPRFIVVSGFREFEYAQRALRFGVEDYLLKPIDQEEINVVLRQLIAKMNQEHDLSDEQRRVEGMLGERTAILRQSELKQLVFDPEHLLKTEFFHFGEEDGLFCFVTMRMQLQEVTESSVQVAGRVLQNIAARVEKRFAGDCYDLEIVLHEDNCICLLNFSQTAHRRLDQKKEELQRILQESNVKYNPDRLIVAIGRPVASARQLGEALRSAWAAFDLRIRSDCSHVMEFTREVGNERAITETDRKQLSTFLISLREDGVQEYLQTMFSNILLRMPDRLGRLYSELRHLLEELREEMCAEMLRAGEDGGQPLEDLRDDPLGAPTLYYRINNCLSLEELRQLTTGLLTGEIAYWKQKKEGRDSEPVRIAKQYVQENLDRQISLEEVAARAYVSAGYLGILFKQKTGSNFSDYVIEARMEKAKVLLRDTRLTIAEVANQVGYADARHFSKVFNKIYKIKPTMYRKFYS